MPHLLTSSKWSRGGGGSGVFETGAGFWYVTEPKHRAVWNFGFVQGMYRPVFYVPGSEGWPPADPLALSIPPNRGDIVYEEPLCHNHDDSHPRRQQPTTTRSPRASVSA